MNDQESEQDKPDKKRLFILLTCLGLALAIPVVCLIVFGIGQVTGVEFSPDDFSRRSFHYNQMPLTGWVVLKKIYTDETTDVEKSLVNSQLVPVVIPKKQRWHLVSESGVSVVSHECDARFLTGYLDKYDDDGNNYWDTWNTEYPKCAKVFWPEVAQLARDEMYLKVAPVMRVAMSISKDNPKPFERELQAVMSEIYLEMGMLDVELGRLKRAKERLERSVQHDPDSKAVQKLETLKSKLATAADEQDDDETGSEADE